MAVVAVPLRGERARAFAVHPALWPALALLALYAAIYAQFAARLLAFPFDLDQGEGYDAWSAWLINLGQAPYSDNAAFPYYSSNYPPVWSYLVSVPMAWLGPGLAPARAVSTLAALLASGVVGLAAARGAGSRLAGVLAAGLFLASPYVFHTTPLARVNATALCFGLLGLALVETPTRWRTLLGSAALLAALFTKQTELDATLACLLFLLAVAPRRAALAAAVIGGVGLAGLLALNALSRGAFWLNVVSGNANPFDLGQLHGYLQNFLLLHLVILALAVAQALRSRGRSPWAYYLLTSAAMAMGVAKWGAGESYFLGVIAAACVLAGQATAWLLRVAPRTAPYALGTGLAVQLLVLAHGPVSQTLAWLPDRGPQAALLGQPPSEDDLRAGELIVGQLRRFGGPVLSEDPSFAVAAGKPLVGNATHLRNLYQAGLWDPAPLVSDLQARRYAVVVLNAQLYPEPVLVALGRAYYLASSVRMNGATYQLFLPGRAE